METSFKIISVSSLSTTHQVGLNAMKSVLGNSLHLIPTAIIAGVASSQNAVIKKLDIEDLLEATILDAIHNSQKVILVTGFFSEANQVYELLRLCKRYKNDILRIYVDPICGDNGKAYNSYEVIEALKVLIKYADYTTPNTTELSLLTDSQHLELGIRAWRGLTSSKLILTSVRQNQQIGTLIQSDQGFLFEGHNPIAGNFIGTGDTYLALFIYFKEIIQQSLKESNKSACLILNTFIEKASLQQTQQLNIHSKWEHYSTS